MSQRTTASPLSDIERSELLRQLGYWESRYVSTESRSATLVTLSAISVALVFNVVATLLSVLADWEVRVAIAIACTFLMVSLIASLVCLVPFTMKGAKSNGNLKWLPLVNPVKQELRHIGQYLSAVEQLQDSMLSSADRHALLFRYFPDREQIQDALNQSTLDREHFRLLCVYRAVCTMRQIATLVAVIGLATGNCIVFAVLLALI